MKFKDWLDTCSDDEIAMSRKHDTGVWEDALITAIEDLRAQHTILVRSNLRTVASGVNISIEILSTLLEDST